MFSGHAAERYVRPHSRTATTLREMTDTPHILDTQQVGFSTMLVVRDISVSERFYVQHFGFKVTERLDSLRRLERVGVTIYLVLSGAPTVDKPNVTLAPQPKYEQPAINLIFRVKDVHTVYAHLISTGLQFLAPPTQPAWGGWRCFVQDPDGYLIEIEQP